MASGIVRGTPSYRAILSFQSQEGIFLGSIVWEPSGNPGRKTHEIVEFPLKTPQGFLTLTVVHTQAPEIQ